MTDPSNMREVAKMQADGTMVIVEDATSAELRQVITMLSGLYFEKQAKVKDLTTATDYVLDDFGYTPPEMMEMKMRVKWRPMLMRALGREAKA